MSRMLAIVAIATSVVLGYIHRDVECLFNPPKCVRNRAKIRSLEASEQPPPPVTSAAALVEVIAARRHQASPRVLRWTPPHPVGGSMEEL